MSTTALSNQTPFHIAFIPDGNRRWARKNNKSELEGHTYGYKNMIHLALYAKRKGVKIVTFWVFSTENWNRSRREVGHLMHLAETVIHDIEGLAIKHKIRIIHFGRKDRLNIQLKNEIKRIEQKTKQYTDFSIVLALDYGGQDEIIRGIKKIPPSQTHLRAMSPELFATYLDTYKLEHPNPDLIIRTGGEKRLSGFMVWQCAYSELIFIKKYFPDFNYADLRRCIVEYGKRQRRFGK